MTQKQQNTDHKTPKEIEESATRIVDLVLSYINIIPPEKIKKADLKSLLSGDESVIDTLVDSLLPCSTCSHPKYKHSRWDNGCLTNLTAKETEGKRKKKAKTKSPFRCECHSFTPPPSAREHLDAITKIRNRATPIETTK